MSDHKFHEGPAGGVPYILREGDESYPLHVLMLHGWSGDERVMWVLESVLPEQAPVASLRGRFPLNGQGFQWTDQQASIQTTMQDFSEAIDAVEETIAKLTDEHRFDPDRLVLMGFSQGAALCFALAESLETQPKAVVVLAGYYPEGTPDKIAEIPVYWGHGTRDELVPVERARRDVEKLESEAAKVHFCETDVGHKLGIECTRGLKRWLKALIGESGS
ncbi:MAG: dienelactone hydrolase family protein [Anaerolineales bacterium]|nr:dienelactone hydrolase family protein [Anaerolineales bacterium]